MKKIIPIVAVGLAILAYLVWSQHRREPLIVSGFIEADEIRVGSRVGGRVAETLAFEGQKVSKGSPLFTIDPFDLKERLAKAQANQAAKKAAYDRLVAGPRPAEIQIAEENLKKTQAELEFARAEHTRLTKLSESGQTAQSELDNAERMLKSSGAAVAASEKELSLLREGTRKEDIAQSLAELQSAQADTDTIQVQMRELSVDSPCDCVVETIDLRPGDLVAPNAPAVVLLDTSNLWVRAYVPASHLGDVRLDQPVQVSVDSFPNESFRAIVTFIAKEGEFTPRNIQTPEERSKQVF